MLLGPSQGFISLATSVGHIISPIQDLQIQNSQLQQRLSLLEAENLELKRSLESSVREGLGTRLAGFPKLHSLVTSSKQPILHLVYKSGSDDVSERCNLCT